ncbi:SCP2 domain-containing protein [Polynucleobacter brandtiae]|uniref:Ubiquinone biosynthesis accessory factor UbiJ n=1 Tax=Polynucleobacter brandtiae TaxID=1938816 RepID=A0A2M8VQA4_9BURK|nr:hypothetical protein [Polynucleobacter brandtiae]PJI79349.1 ubiquinone biosynthesis protein UbiJ [Polynucleobacter brandtiae]
MNTISPTTHSIAAATACRGINHVLTAEPWAMSELARHAGKVILLKLPVGDLYFELTLEGLLRASSAVEGPTLELLISADALTALMGSSGSFRDQAIKAVRITGDADLAQLLGRLAGQVRWEYEEDLARFIGDAPAHFAVQQSQKLILSGRTAVRDLLENVVEYVSEEKKILLNKQDFMVRKNELSALRDAVDRMEKRIQFLEKKG